MSSHSTHIASDCDYKNLNIIYCDNGHITKSFSPFIENAKDKIEEREQLLLMRYLDATRSEFFSAVLFHPK